MKAKKDKDLKPSLYSYFNLTYFLLRKFLRHEIKSFYIKLSSWFLEVEVIILIYPDRKAVTQTQKC